MTFEHKVPRLNSIPDKFEQVRIEKLRKIEALGLDPWGGRFDDRKPIAHLRQNAPAEPGTTTDPVRTAGRILAIRDKGKVWFIDLEDKTGRIQLLVGKKQVGEDNWSLVKLLDLWDLIGVEGDLGRALLDAANGELSPDSLAVAAGSAVCVVLASGGYPGSYEKGFPISGLEVGGGDDLIVFHAGTAEREGEIVTAGGRVLGVTAVGGDIRGAVNRAYDGISSIEFEGMYYRPDIAWRALARD